jgi:hypothetical protein
MALKFPPKVPSVESTQPPTPPSTEEKKPEAPTSSDQIKYKALRLKRYAKKNGTVVLPDAEGFYTPADAEEENILTYFAAQNLSYVERV